MSERIPGRLTVERGEDGKYFWEWQSQRKEIYTGDKGYPDRSAAKNAGLKFAKAAKRNLR